MWKDVGSVSIDVTLEKNFVGALFLHVDVSNQGTRHITTMTVEVSTADQYGDSNGDKQMMKFDADIYPKGQRSMFFKKGLCNIRSTRPYWQFSSLTSGAILESISMRFDDGTKEEHNNLQLRFPHCVTNLVK